MLWVILCPLIVSLFVRSTAIQGLVPRVSTYLKNVLMNRTSGKPKWLCWFRFTRRSENKPKTSNKILPDIIFTIQITLKLVLRKMYRYSCHYLGTANSPKMKWTKQSKICVLCLTFGTCTACVICQLKYILLGEDC